MGLGTLYTSIGDIDVYVNEVCPYVPKKKKQEIIVTFINKNKPVVWDIFLGNDINKAIIAKETFAGFDKDQAVEHLFRSALDTYTEKWLRSCLGADGLRKCGTNILVTADGLDRFERIEGSSFFKHYFNNPKASNGFDTPHT